MEIQTLMTASSLALLFSLIAGAVSLYLNWKQAKVYEALQTQTLMLRDISFNTSRIHNNVVLSYDLLKSKHR